MPGKYFIQNAIKKPGALKASAKKSKKSISGFCAQKGLSSTSKKRCNLAKTLSKLRKKK